MYKDLTFVYVMSCDSDVVLNPKTSVEGGGVVKPPVKGLVNCYFVVDVMFDCKSIK